MKAKLSRKALIEDIRQLTNIIETAHPDPYFKGGGRVAYHRRLQKLIRSIPPEGMHINEFRYHLMPFLASIQDGHTSLLSDQTSQENVDPGGIPLIFGAIEEKLYVRSVVYAEHKKLIGCLLVSVEDISVDELIQRVKEYFGCENQYQALGKLGNNPALLFYRETLKMLIPKWQNSLPELEIRVELKHPSGEIQTHVFDTSVSNLLAEIKSEHPNHLPPLTDTQNPYFFFQFLDGIDHHQEKIAVLRIANMITFREVYEYFRSNGMEIYESWGRRVFQRFYPNETVPDDYDKVISGIPTASSVFCDLFKAMKVDQTKYLIVDLRDNQGGNSLMNQLFTYYLVGVEKTVELLKINGTVRKLSEFLVSMSEGGLDLKQIPYAQEVPLDNSAYDFTLDPDFSGEQYESSLRADLERDFAKMPSFYPEFISRENEAIYFPKQIFILSSEQTFSTGYNLMADLYQLGGKVIGIPSGQAGNSCGDVRPFVLNNSNLQGNVSTKTFIAFPDDPESGELLQPHYPLTYEQFKTYAFDENSALRYALELIADKY